MSSDTDVTMFAGVKWRLLMFDDGSSSSLLLASKPQLEDVAEEVVETEGDGPGCRAVLVVDLLSDGIGYADVLVTGRESCGMDLKMYGTVGLDVPRYPVADCALLK